MTLAQTALPVTLNEEVCDEIKKSCTDLMEAADITIKTYEIELEKSDQIIGNLNLQLSRTQDEKLRQEQEARSWYRNPIVYLSLGVVLGAIVVK